MSDDKFKRWVLWFLVMIALTIVAKDKVDLRKFWKTFAKFKKDSKELLKIQEDEL